MRDYLTSFTQYPSTSQAPIFLLGKAVCAVGPMFYKFVPKMDIAVPKGVHVALEMPLIQYQHPSHQRRVKKSSSYWEFVLGPAGHSNSNVFQKAITVIINIAMRYSALGDIK